MTQISRGAMVALALRSQWERAYWLEKASKEEAEIALKAAQPILPSTLAPPTQQDFIQLIRASRIELREIANLLADGTLSPREWAERFKQVLNRGHMNAWALGRQRMGDLIPLNFMDAIQGVAHADGEADWLLGFRDAIESRDKRYFDADGNLRIEPVMNRSNLYTGKMRGTANESFALAAPAEAEIWWRLGGTENHCSDCPVVAGLNPFTKDTLFQHPGDGEAPCLSNCKCWLEIIDDGDVFTGFKPVR